MKYKEVNNLEISQSTLIAIIGFVATVLTTYFSNHFALKTKKLDFEQQSIQKTRAHDLEILEEYLSSVFNLSVLASYTSKENLNVERLHFTDVDRSHFLSQYKSSLGKILPLVSEKTVSDLLYADSQIDSADIIGGIMSVQQILNVVANEIKNRDLNQHKNRK